MSRSRSLSTFALALVLGASFLPHSAGAAGTGSTTSSVPKLTYKPKPKNLTMPARPDPDAVPKANPTGNWNAYDLNVFETIWFPERQAGDESAKDAPGGAIAHGVCPPTGCPNHSLEFVKFWKKSLTSIVKPFGGVVRSYEFENQGSASPPYVFATPSGPAHNLQAIIPGAVHPERMVIVSGHYDQTDSGPGSAWDSAEGHATVLRIAKLMTDHWRKTGTRPAVSVKFTAWAGEESGTNGSKAYIRDNLAPFGNLRTLAYFNLDPCGGAYPATYRGNPEYHVKMVMQLSNPDQSLSPAHRKSVLAFNKQALRLRGEVFNHLDDSLTDVPGEPEVFISDEEAEKQGVESHEPLVVPALGGLAIFSSDYANFEAIQVPIYNLFPDVLGPHDGGVTKDFPYHVDGIAILHTPNDNLLTLNAMTGPDQTGMTASQGWYKGLELCAHMNATFMLEPNMGGAVKKTNGPVAYFEVLHKAPAPLAPKKNLTFDALGSHAYANGRLVPASLLDYRWNFGDGSKAKGLKVAHAFAKNGTYEVVLTVMGPGGVDKMTTFVKIGS
ncbi:MAG: M28 family peptidase [Actinomycetota bacterium]